MTPAEKQGVITGLGPNPPKDIAAAVKAGDAIKDLFLLRRNLKWYDLNLRVCRHHAIALKSVLDELGYANVSIHAEFSLT